MMCVRNGDIFKDNSLDMGEVMSINKNIRKRCHQATLFASSATIFVLMGMVDRIGAVTAIFSFPIFFLASYYLNIPKPNIKQRGWLYGVPILLIVAAIRSTELYYELNNSSKIQSIYEMLHINAKIGDVKVGAIIFTAGIIVLSLYSIISLVTMIPKEKENRRNLGENRIFWVLLIISVIYTFGISTCGPLVRGIPGGDFSIFYIIGKMWRDGYLPYVDLFDHKGPFIFWIYFLGLKINQTYGIYILQTISLWLTLCIAYKLVSKTFKFDQYMILSVTGILVFYTNVQFGQALTEEFCMPFLMLGAYFVDRYLSNRKKEIRHTPYYSIVYGIAVGVCFCTRVTNAISIVIWVLSIPACFVPPFRREDTANPVGMIPQFRE